MWENMASHLWLGVLLFFHIMQNTTVEFIIKNLHLEESNWKVTDVTILLLKYHLINKQEAYLAFIISTS